MRAIPYIASILSITFFVLVAAPLLRKEPASEEAPVTQSVLSETERAETELTGAGQAAAQRPTPPRPDRFYRWRDANGHIHYRSSPPPASIAAQEIPFKRPAPAAAPETTPVPQATARAPAAGADVGWRSLLSVYTPQGMAELKEAVERTAEHLDERRQRLDALQEQVKKR